LERRALDAGAYNHRLALALRTGTSGSRPRDAQVAAPLGGDGTRTQR
jgi:hypothetical protein